MGRGFESLRRYHICLPLTLAVCRLTQAVRVTEPKGDLGESDVWHGCSLSLSGRYPICRSYSQSKKVVSRPFFETL